MQVLHFLWYIIDADKHKVLMERELIQAILNGNTSRYAEIVEKYQQMVANLCYKLAGNSIDIEETTHVVFVELYVSLPRFNYKSKLSTYIYRITLNTVSKALGYNKRYTKLDEEYEYMLDADTVEHKILRAESEKKLYWAIDRLKYEQKVALTLYCFDGMSYKEVAETMEVSLSKVETLIHRAKKNLKKILTEK